MKKGLYRYTVLVVILILLSVTVPGCGVENRQDDPSPTEQDQQTEEQAVTKGSYSVAFSNSYIGNAYRTQTVSAFEEYAEHLKEIGILNEYYISSSGKTPQAQIDEVRNIMAEGYDAIVINAASPTELVPVLEEAVNSGIVVVAFDNVVESRLVYNTGVNNYHYGYMQAAWLIDKLGGKGNIITVRGIEGTTVSNERGRGYSDVLGQYPDIHIVGEIWGAWDHTIVKNQIGEMLDRHMADNIVGVIDEAGGEAAIIEAMADRGMDMQNVFITGGVVNGFLRAAKQYNVDFMAYGYPPYMSARALELAIKLLEGEKIEYDGFIEIENQVVRPENIDEFILTDEPDEVFADITDTEPYAF